MLRLKADLGTLLGSGFVGYNDAAEVVVRGHRDGQGFRAFLMNFVIENAVGQPYYRIRQPKSGFHLDPPFQLLAPDGTSVGELKFRMNRASLEIPGQLPLTASLPTLSWHGYTVDQGTVSLASVSFVGHPISLTGADLELRFEPLGSAVPQRRWVVALVSWATLFAPPWDKWTTR